MTSKRKLRRKIARLEVELLAAKLKPLDHTVTFQNLTVDWTERTVYWHGRTIKAGPEQQFVVPIVEGRIQ